MFTSRHFHVLGLRTTRKYISLCCDQKAQTASV